MVTITQPVAPAPEVPAEVIATAIAEISASMRALNSTRLTREAVVVLIHDYSKVSKGTIRIVLNNLESLEKTWLKPKPVR